MQQAWELAVEPLLLECIEDSDSIEKELLTLEQFVHAFQIYSSRAFLPKEEVGEALVPLADLFNHKAAHVNQQILEDASGNEAYIPLLGRACIIARLEGVDLGMRPDILVGCRDDNVLAIIAVQDIAAKREVFNTYGEFGMYCAHRLVEST